MHRQFYQMKPETTAVPTIGIAGVTIPGAVDCIKKINMTANNKFPSHHHPAIILQQPNFGPTHLAQKQNRWDLVENTLVATIDALTEAGADFAIIPANTVHRVIENVIRRTTLPILNMLELVADECQRLNLKKVGILGTQWTMADHLYETVLRERGIEEIIPTTNDQVIVQQAIFQELIPTGAVTSTTLQALLGVIAHLKTSGCDGIVLACTELPLVLNSQNCNITTLDTTAVLAEAAIAKSLSLMQKNTPTITAKL